MVLFDTTYLLPFAGVAVNIPNLEKHLKSLETIEIKKFITQPNLIEIKWKAIREYNKSSNPEILVRANSAIMSFYHGSHFEVINSWRSNEILSLADDVLMMGHHDYMDALFLASGKHHKLPIISEDDAFSRIIEELEWEIEILNWRKFVEKHKL